MAVDRRRLAAWISRVGERVAAGKSGVSVATLRGWLRRGVSSRGTARVEESIRRSEISVKAAETRRRRQEEFGRGFTLPPRAKPPRRGRGGRTYGGDPSGGLTPAQLTPKRPPPAGRWRRRIGERRELVTPTRVEVSEMFEVDLNYLDWVASGRQDAMADEFVRAWKRSGHRMAWFSVLVQRFFPKNPAYRGEMVLKAGTWSKPEWLSSKARNYEPDVHAAVAAAFAPRAVGAGSIEEAAESRTIWILACNFRFYTSTPPERGMPGEVETISDYDEEDDE